MLFNSYIFIFLFLPLVLFGYYGFRYFKQDKLAFLYLIGMSLWFYGYNNIYYLPILMASICVNHVLAAGMDYFSKKEVRNVLLWGSILWNLGILFVFKYYDFFMGNMNQAFGWDVTFLNIALPLGISFYTFQQLSYVIDVYRRECKHYSLLDYATYVTFFPQLIAGPIVYHSELIPQFRKEENRKINYSNLSKGLYAFALGLAKKVLLADTFSKIVTVGYGSISGLNAISTVVVMVCYSLQIYFDFSGYCDMALGIGYFFNVELPINFNSPYKAASIVEFWDRWHMTLTRFFTKYIYIPLGGSRKGKLRTYVNILIVFAVSGLWHGANWTFILWGIINGIANVLEKWLGKPYHKLPKPVKVLATFSFTTFAWSLFRAESFSQARELWSRMGKGGWSSLYGPITDTFNDLIEMKFLYRAGFSGVIDQLPWLFLILFIVLALLACFFLKNTQEKIAEMKFSKRETAMIFLCIIWSIVSLSEVSEFLYFNF